MAEGEHWPWSSVRPRSRALEEEGRSQRQRRRSYEAIPPYMSGLNVNRETYAEEKTLNLVLCGRAGPEKSSVLESITGQSSVRLSQEPCEKHQAEVCGRWVSVLELPPLSGSDKPVEELMEQCLSLCGPQGVQAFILVLPLGHFTDEDKSELRTIQDMFSSAVRPFMMVLFTVDSEPSAPVSVGRDLQELCQDFGGGYLTFNTSSQHQVAQLPLLLDSVEKLRAKNKPDSYTTKTLIQGFRRMVTTQARQIQDLQHKGAVSGSEASDCLKITLLGKTGCGKSSSGNTILGRTEFEAEMSSSSVTQSCAKAETEVDGQRVVVVDTPGLFDNRISNDEIIEEMTKCVSLLAPGPHVILLVLQIGRFTPEEKQTIELIKKSFGKESQKYTMILFTWGDGLSSSVERYLERSDSSLKKLLSDHGNRYHVFNNKDKENVSQVKELIKKINNMVQANKGNCYTNDMFQNAEATIRKEMERIMKEKEEEMRREREEMERKHKQEMKEEKEKMENERQQREQELREKEERLEKEEGLRKEGQEKREKEERKRREQEERQRQEWEQKQKELEEKIRSESKSKEAIDQKLQESRSKMEEERGKWENERREWWQKRKEEDEEQKQKLQNLQDEYDRQKKADQEVRKRQEEEKVRELENKHKKEMEDSKTKAENEARREAEKEFQKEAKEKIEQHRKDINDLVRCICKKKNNVKRIKEKLDEHEKRISGATDEKRKEAMLKKQEKELNTLIQLMLLEEGEPTNSTLLKWVAFGTLPVLLTAIVLKKL